MIEERNIKTGQKTLAEVQARRSNKVLARVQARTQQEAFGASRFNGIVFLAVRAQKRHIYSTHLLFQSHQTPLAFPKSFARPMLTSPGTQRNATQWI